MTDKLYTQADLDRARTEAAAEMVEQAAEVARASAGKWEQHGAGSLPDEDTQAYFRGGVNASYEIEKTLLALSPDPDYSTRIRREVLEEVGAKLKSVRGVSVDRDNDLDKGWDAAFDRAEGVIRALKEK